MTFVDHGEVGQLVDAISESESESLDDEFHCYILVTAGSIDTLSLARELVLGFGVG